MYSLLVQSSVGLSNIFRMTQDTSAKSFKSGLISSYNNNTACACKLPRYLRKSTCRLGFADGRNCPLRAHVHEIAVTQDVFCHTRQLLPRIGVVLPS